MPKVISRYQIVSALFSSAAPPVECELISVLRPETNSETHSET